MARKNKTALPKYVSASRDRHKKLRLRFRKGLTSIYLKSPFPSDEFDREYQAALKNERVAVTRVGKARQKPGSMSSVIASYYQSPEFRGTAVSTQRTYRGICESIRREHGTKAIADLTRAHVKAIIGKKAATPAAANNYLRMLRILIKHAIDIELIARDPTVKMKGYGKKTDGFHTWTEEEIAIYERRHPIGTKPRLAMALMLYTGQRRGDAVKLGWLDVTGNRIKVRQEKTGTRLAIKMHGSLIDALEMVRGSNYQTLLVTHFGKAFTAAGFGNWFRDRCNEAGLTHCTAHGLRKAAARRLAEAGNSANHIAAVTGHLSLKEVEVYTRDADQQKMADAAVDTMPERSDRKREELIQDVARVLVADCLAGRMRRDHQNHMVDGRPEPALLYQLMFMRLSGSKIRVTEDEARIAFEAAWSTAIAESAK
ncbi:tyrosine-type recombinase/integrase [Rhizobium sp. KVB221]|uniref:Tyrosine-type recombinase/integrase n=1 Tax=Rhizobium setariae TaxID=2801340 RepID=A0A937CR05_9HYPH|nr:tyrosine-type recombinase/integrase [Rhizobium setariae]MBL0375204.1 tyrosine-type recombinase/integrase [Rhizobium setariae]